MLYIHINVPSNGNGRIGAGPAKREHERKRKARKGGKKKKEKRKRKRKKKPRGVGSSRKFGRAIPPQVRIGARSCVLCSCQPWSGSGSKPDMTAWRSTECRADT